MVWVHPVRSIPLAFKWCRRSEWIRLDSVPFSSLTRDCGALLGLGVAQHWRPVGWSLSRGQAALSVALSGAGLHLLHRLVLPSQPQGLFYCLFFLKFLLVPQLVMMLVPTVVQLCTPRKWKDQWGPEPPAGCSMIFKVSFKKLVLFFLTRYELEFRCQIFSFEVFCTSSFTPLLRYRHCFSVEIQLLWFLISRLCKCFPRNFKRSKVNIATLTIVAV